MGFIVEDDGADIIRIENTNPVWDSMVELPAGLATKETIEFQRMVSTIPTNSTKG